MSQTVRGVISRAKKQPIELVDIVIPDPGPGEVVVDIIACGVCHTDLTYREGGINDEYPFLLGHEAAGTVEAIGAGVTHVKEGDRVGVPWLYSACGCCEHCLTGWETLCEAQQNSGYSVNGGFAEYALANANYVGLLPKEDAVQLGVVGPVARGSGVAIDVRKDSPYAAYGKLDFKSIVEPGCCVNSRTMVRLHEIFESFSLIRQCIERMPDKVFPNPTS